jgi:HCOMODA/2-hydroxy-3-carboxy-muconic semialdehyde decarboxylase
MSSIRRSVLASVLAAGLAPASAWPVPPVSAGQRGASASPLDRVLDDLVIANHVLALENIVDGYGHVSARHPGRSDTFLLSRSLAPELVTRVDLMEYDLEGRPLDARGRASYQERFIHSEIYKARPDVGAIVHCHTISLIPFANSDVPLRPMFHMSFFVADGIPVFEIRNAGGMTDLLVKDAKLGHALAATLGSRPAALMRGHGAVVVADTIPTVVGRSVYLDQNARMQVQAMTLGGAVTYVDPAEARLREGPGNYDRSWDLWKRKVAVGK